MSFSLPFLMWRMHGRKGGNINRIFFHDDGWKITFRSDGSADVVFGSQDGARTAPDLFDLDAIEAEIRPLLEEAKDGPAGESTVAVGIRYGVSAGTAAKKVKNTEVIRNLCRELFRNAQGWMTW